MESGAWASLRYLVESGNPNVHLNSWHFPGPLVSDRESERSSLMAHRKWRLNVNSVKFIKNPEYYGELAHGNKSNSIYLSRMPIVDSLQLHGEFSCYLNEILRGLYHVWFISVFFFETTTSFCNCVELERCSCQWYRWTITERNESNTIEVGWEKERTKEKEVWMDSTSDPALVYSSKNEKKTEGNSLKKFEEDVKELTVFHARRQLALSSLHPPPPSRSNISHELFFFHSPPRVVIG